KTSAGCGGRELKSSKSNIQTNMNYRSVLAGAFFLISLLHSVSLDAQDRNAERYSFEFKGEPLTEALEEIAKKAGIDLVYDPAIVKSINIYERIQHQTVPDLLRSMLAGTALDFLTLSSGTVVIVRT